MTLWEYLLLAPVSLLVIINPVSTVPLFLAITPGDSPGRRTAMARTACLVAGGVLFFFALTGELLFDVLGITLPAFRIAGGLLLFSIGFEMVRAPENRRRLTDEEARVSAEANDISVTPLAVPLLSGPGAISTTVLLASKAEGWAHRAILWASIAVVLALSYLVLSLGARGAGWLNPVALRLTQRLSGLLLTAIAVQFVLDGWRDSGLAR